MNNFFFYTAQAPSVQPVFIRQSYPIIIQTQQRAPLTLDLPPQNIILRNERPQPIYVRQQAPNIIIQNDSSEAAVGRLGCGGLGLAGHPYEQGLPMDRAPTPLGGHFESVTGNVAMCNETRQLMCKPMSPMDLMQPNHFVAHPNQSHYYPHQGHLTHNYLNQNAQAIQQGLESYPNGGGSNCFDNGHTNSVSHINSMNSMNSIHNINNINNLQYTQKLAGMDQNVQPVYNCAGQDAGNGNGNYAMDHSTYGHYRN